MGDKTNLDYQIAVLDTLSALVDATDVAAKEPRLAHELIERLRVLKEERVRALREWYPEPPSPPSPPPA